MFINKIFNMYALQFGILKTTSSLSYVLKTYINYCIQYVHLQKKIVSAFREKTFFIKPLI